MSAAVNDVAEALERVVLPDTVRAEEEAFPKVVCPLTVRVETVVVANVEVPVTPRVPFAVKEDVAVRVPNVAVPPVKEERVAVTAFRMLVKKLVEVALVVMTSVNVLTPANDWEVVEIRPRAVKEAVGRLKEWIEEVEEMVKSVPVEVTAKVCDAAVCPFKEVSPPPAPASAPQEKRLVVEL